MRACPKDGDSEFALLRNNLLQSLAPSKHLAGPDLDKVWISGILTIAVQCFFAATPWMPLRLLVCHGDYRWRYPSQPLHKARSRIGKRRNGNVETSRKKASKKDMEKKRLDKTISLTCGNGSRHLFVIISEDVGFELEDLAGGQDASRPLTALYTISLAFLWVVLLLTTTRRQEQNPVPPLDE
ncbi:hypothetical protein MMC08_008933 [Hypocenomyce scalaris]|nr:hypothetical protein [Hypocenomyce scalaris]